MDNYLSGSREHHRVMLSTVADPSLLVRPLRFDREFGKITRPDNVEGKLRSNFEQSLFLSEQKKKKKKKEKIGKKNKSTPCEHWERESRDGLSWGRERGTARILS